jgi:hypothetical protein
MMNQLLGTGSTHLPERTVAPRSADRGARSGRCIGFAAMVPVAVLQDLPFEAGSSRLLRALGEDAEAGLPSRPNLERARALCLTSFLWRDGSVEG